MTTATQAQTIVDNYESDREDYWDANKALIMKSFYDKIESKAKLGLESTVFPFRDMDGTQIKYLDFIKAQLTDDDYEIGEINGVIDCKW